MLSGKPKNWRAADTNGAEIEVALWSLPVASFGSFVASVPPPLGIGTITLREIAWRAQLRQCSRYRRLAARGLHQNKACVAIARELAGFVWDIARQVKPAA